MSKKVIVMAIKPKYAKAIYEGRKNWEFRKTPPPLFKTVFLYETEPVSAVTGAVVFGEAVTGLPMPVLEIVKTNRCFTKNLTGISLVDLEEYAGNKLVTALRVTESVQCKVRFDAKPPQNWGRYELVSGDKEVQRG
ncbi:MAG: hypothetical protein IKO64_06020 [Kiritimatiellae bacterium]|nr:hypothetical protein [Kiritimatiellia bacterium]